MAVNINVPSQVKTYANLAAFPASGALKTIYIAEDTNKTYRWTGSVYVEVSAAGATGITIGTTAITSGTVGRVLFEGTGNVVQESANLFWDNTNVRLGIGGTPTNTLNVVGSTTTFDVVTWKSSTGNTGYLGSDAGQIAITTASGGGGSFLSMNTNNFTMSCGALWRALVGGTERMRIPTTGNVLINTTTDAGFKLDVNGTARVSGNTTIVGNITQSGANTTNLGYITNATLGVYGNTPAASTIGLLVGCVTNGGHTAIFTKGNNSGSTAIRITDQNVGASINHFLVDFAGASGFGIANGTTVVNSSAQVEIQSTTKGFLPPRMTTTQKNAIATPATGLMVYDTTLNLISYYNGTSWI